MSKPRLEFHIQFDTVAHAEAVKTRLQIQLVGKNIFETHYLTTESDEDDQTTPLLRGEIRFNNQIDLDSLRDWTISAISSHTIIRTWVRSARFLWHLCTHDDSTVQHCLDTDFQEFHL